MKDEIFLTQFYSSFLSLCKRDGMTPSAAAKKAGISSGAPTAWKNGAVPKPAQRDKLCKLFSVSDDELLGYKKEKPSADSRELIGPKKQALIDKVKIMSDSEVDAFLTLLDR